MRSPWVAVCLNVASVEFESQDVRTDELLQQSEQAMRYAKLKNLDHVLYGKDIGKFVEREVEISKQLFSALHKNEICVNYQLQVDAKTEQPVGVEALVRWQNSHLGSVGPEEFIPIAERTGLIYDIGLFVMKTAFRDAQKLNGLTVSVNVSPVQLLNPNFSEVVETAIIETNMNPKLVLLEITENLIESEIDYVMGNISRLIDIGIRFSIDDFGKGFSSLSYLTRLPVHEIKIDRSYINGMEKDKKYLGVVQATLTFAAISKVKVVAEGVETKNQKNMLMEMNCDYLQGYFFHKPEPFNSILYKVKEHNEKYQ